MHLTPRFLLLAGALALPLFAATAPKAPKSADVSKLDPAMGVNAAAAANLEWHDITRWGVEGREWINEERLRWFDRFPAAAQKTVTPAVWFKWYQRSKP
jgi:hypothetical protein